MHTKSELEEMSIEALTELAHSLNISTKKNPEKIELIYNIIGAESESPALVTEKQPKKRGRKSKAEKEALEAAKAKETSSETSEGQPDAEKLPDEQAAAPEAPSTVEEKPADAPAPKKRGRKSKAEKAALEAAAREAEQTLFDAAENTDAASKLPDADSNPESSVTESSSSEQPPVDSPEYENFEPTPEEVAAFF